MMGVILIIPIRDVISKNKRQHLRLNTSSTKTTRKNKTPIRANPVQTNYLEKLTCSALHSVRVETSAS